MRTLLRSRNAEAREVDRVLTRLAATPLPLLVAGETGTGKSWVARRIHGASRPGRPLVVVDCGALPAPLVAAELFGHGAGAFTDATRAREGTLSRVGEGSLVLDRVDAMPAEGQVALLRVLEERHFTPVGRTTPQPFRARVIALASVDAAVEAAGSPLRADLYHRLAGAHVVLPPLRVRREDIVPLARAHLARLGRRGGRRVRLDSEAEALLCAYAWPGNVRELRNFVERQSLLRPDPRRFEIDADAAFALSPQTAGESVSAPPPIGELPLREMLERHERRLLEAALSQAAGNIASAARLLKLDRGNLHRRLRALGLVRAARRP
jgi:two-component system nitrogen regulation response regulator NtrX